MITKNELRIGNYIGMYVGVNLKYYVVNNISWMGVKTDTNAEYGYGYIHAIPITEEWLLKFGFEKKYQTFEFKGLNIDGTVVHFSFDKWCSEYDIENCDFIEIPAECKHVHQLQNLYFALTNEEL